MVTSSYTMVEGYSPLSHLPSHQSSHLPSQCKSQSQGYISHSPAYISHTPSSTSCKRKLPNEFDSYPVSPPKQRVYSMLHNTPKQHRNESKQMLRMAVKKLRAIDNPETNLCRSVLINNTVRRLRTDIKEQKRNGFQKTKPSQHYSMDYAKCDRTNDKCDRTSDKCDRIGDIIDSNCDTKDDSDISDNHNHVSDNSADTDKCDARHQDAESVICDNASDGPSQTPACQNERFTQTDSCKSSPRLHSLSQSTYHSPPQCISYCSPLLPLSDTESDFAHIVPDDPHPSPDSARSLGYDVTKDTMMSYPDPVVMDTSDSEEFIDIMTVDDENTPLDLSINSMTQRNQDTTTICAKTSFAERISAEHSNTNCFLNPLRNEEQQISDESLLSDRLILSDMEAVFNKIMNVITDSCHGANLSHEIPTFMSEIPTITSSS